MLDRLERIPAAYRVTVWREANNGGWWISAEKNMGGGKLTVRSGTKPTFLEAFQDIWRKL